MKIFWKISLIFIVVVLIATIGLNVFFAVKGKNLFIQALEGLFGRPVTVRSVRVYPPLTFVARDLIVKDLCSIGKLSASVDPLGVLRKQLVFLGLSLDDVSLEIVRSGENITIHESINASSGSARSAEDATAGTDALEPREGDAKSAGKQQKIPAHADLIKGIWLKQFRLSNGTVSFKDQGSGDRPVLVTVKHITIWASNILLPVTRSTVTSFKVSGRIPSQDQQDEGVVSFNGWIDLFKRDMRAELAMRDIDAVSLNPYYADWVDVEKANIGKARLNFSSSIVGLRNDINAACHAELTRVDFKPRSAEEPRGRAERIASSALIFFKAINQGKMELDFNFKTTMDNPRFGLGVIKDAITGKITEVRKARAFKVEDAVKFPGKIVEGAVESATDLTKSVINSTITVGKELTSAVAASFHRESEPMAEDQDIAAASEARTEKTVNQTSDSANQTQ